MTENLQTWQDWVELINMIFGFFTIILVWSKNYFQSLKKQVIAIVFIHLQAIGHIAIGSFMFAGIFVALALIALWKYNEIKKSLEKKEDEPLT